MPKRAPKTLDANALWDFALKLLGGRPLSVSELRQKLLRRAEEPGAVDTVISKLKEYGYLNDQTFAESFASARRDNQGFGRGRVIRDLRQRRVSSQVADRAVAQIYQQTDEDSMVEGYLNRKYRNRNLTELLEDEKQLASAFRRLRYAGFSAGASIRVLKRFASRAEELEAVEADGGEPGDSE